MDNRRSRFVVFLLGDPHLLEGGEGSQDRTSDPDGVFTFWRSDNLNLHRLRSKVLDFLLHSVGNTREHGSTSGKDGVGIEILTDIDVALHDAVIGGFVDAGLFHSDEGWLEEDFRASESFVSDGDDLSVRKFIRLLQRAAALGSGHFLFEIEGDVAELLLDVTNDFTFSSGDEVVSTFCEDLHEIICEIATSQVQTLDGVGESIAFIDRNGVGDS